MVDRYATITIRNRNITKRISKKYNVKKCFFPQKLRFLRETSSENRFSVWRNGRYRQSVYLRFWFFHRHTVQFPDHVREQKRRSGVGLEDDRVQLSEELVRGGSVRRAAVRPVIRVRCLQRRRE